jgi:hypothetical protein
MSQVSLTPSGIEPETVAITSSGVLNLQQAGMLIRRIGIVDQLRRSDWAEVLGKFTNYGRPQAFIWMTSLTCPSGSSTKTTLRL